MKLLGLVLSEEDRRVGSKHLSILSVSSSEKSHFVALHGAAERLGCTHCCRARCYVNVLLLMTRREFLATLDLWMLIL